MESQIEMGFKEGFTMALENLDGLLESKQTTFRDAIKN